MKRLGRALRLGMKSLLLHKLRSGLTALGIVFGVAAVISMLAVGEGSSRDAQEKIEQLGATNIILRSAKPSDERQSAQGGRPSMVLKYGVTYEDYDRIIATVPTIKRALPIREIRKQIRNLDRAIDGRVVGTTHDYAEFNHLEVLKGRFLMAEDNEHYKNYAVLAHGTASVLYPVEDPVGKTVKLGSDYYTIIGVTAERAQSAGVGAHIAAQDYNKDVYIPLSTCRTRFGDKIMDRRSGQMSAEEVQLSQVTLQVHDIDEVGPTVPLLKAIYEPHHPKQDVKITVPYDLLEQARKTARQFNIILGTIASISLLVGGIGIMNIMLATVTERTREIGIRRAIGAKRKDIVEQFLVETVVLAGVGGLVGVALGVGIPSLMVYFIPDVRTIITLPSIGISFSISVGVGIMFGIYPAFRAAKMDPIEALRHE